MPKGKRDIVNADETHRFHINGGLSVGNLIDLKNAFETITDEQYHFHVAPEKNDFAVWVRDVLHDDPASKLLFGCLKKKTAILRIITVLRRYKLDGYNIILPPLVKKERKPRAPQNPLSPPMAPSQTLSSPPAFSPEIEKQISSPSPSITPPPPLASPDSPTENHNPQEGTM